MQQKIRSREPACVLWAAGYAARVLAKLCGCALGCEAAVRPADSFGEGAGLRCW